MTIRGSAKVGRVTPATDPLTIRVARGALCGAVAGVAASFAMDRFQAVAGRVLPTGGGGEPSTERAADVISRWIRGRGVPPAAKPLAGQAVHYALGTALGVIYGVAAEFQPRVGAAAGAAFGVAVATLLDEGAVPAVGLGEAPWRAKAASHVFSYASHLVFGCTAELVRRQVVPGLSRQTGGRTGS